MTDINAIITVVGCALALATFYIGRLSATRAEAREAGSLLTDLKYIKESVDRIEKRLGEDVQRLEGRIDELSRQLSEVSGSSARAYESAKMVHNRLGEHLEREHGQRRGTGDGSA